MECKVWGKGLESGRCGVIGNRIEVIYERWGVGSGFVSYLCFFSFVFLVGIFVMLFDISRVSR